MRNMEICEVSNDFSVQTKSTCYSRPSISRNKSLFLSDRERFEAYSLEVGLATFLEIGVLENLNDEFSVLIEEESN